MLRETKIGIGNPKNHKFHIHVMFILSKRQSANKNVNLELRKSYGPTNNFLIILMTNEKFRKKKINFSIKI